MKAEQLAELFHTTYERLAPEFGYETRPGTAKPWSEIPPENNNKRLMIAVAGEVLSTLQEKRTPELQRIVFEALGEASMCWSERPKGVFDDANAVRIGNEVMEAIKQS